MLSFSFDSLGEGEGLARGMVLKRDVCKLTSTQNEQLRQQFSLLCSNPKEDWASFEEAP